MARICSQCEYYEDFKCKNTKRKQNTISLKIKTAPSWCHFKRVNRSKRKKSPRALLTKELDRLWRTVVVMRAGHQCEMTGKLGGEGRGHALNAHHIFGRSNYSVRWDINNGACLTAGMHTLTRHSAHKAPLEFIEGMKLQRGEKWYNDLRVKANTIKKWTVPELQELKEKLKIMVEKLK